MKKVWGDFFFSFYNKRLAWLFGSLEYVVRPTLKLVWPHLVPVYVLLLVGGHSQMTSLIKGGLRALGSLRSRFLPKKQR